MAELLTAWPTIEESAALLQTSVRTIWRHHERGDLEIQKRPVPGRKPLNVCNPADLEKLKPAPYALRPERPQTEVVSITTGSNSVTIDTIFGKLAELMPPRRPEPINNGMPFWLTIEEASKYSGLSSATLRKAIGHRRITADKIGPRGALVLRRVDLEQFSGDDL